MQRNISRGDITALLVRHRAGDSGAYDEAISLAYNHLRRVARAQLARGWSSETLTTTALVHEAYMQLADETGVEWQDRSHFFAICARAMRRILVDRARHRAAQKRGGGSSPLSLDGIDAGVEPNADLVLAVDEAVSSLERFNGRLARVVECRYFAGLTEEETAAALGSSLRTVQRDWTRARAWLVKVLTAAPERGDRSP